MANEKPVVWVVAYCRLILFLPYNHCRTHNICYIYMRDGLWKPPVRDTGISILKTYTIICDLKTEAFLVGRDATWNCGCFPEYVARETCWCERVVPIFIFRMSGNVRCSHFVGFFLSVFLVVDGVVVVAWCSKMDDFFFVANLECCLKFLVFFSWFGYWY